MDQITNPHDKFFKEVFTRRDTAREFLLNYLPDDVVRLLDLDSLKYTKDSFIDKHLAEYFSDLLLKVSLRDGSKGYVYILFEHKSHPETLAAFHLLRYMVKIWEMWVKKGEKPGFPVIIPLVLYHGEENWRSGLNFKDLFDSPLDMLPFIPDFQYVLWDASKYNDEDIKGEVILQAALLILKYLFRKDLRNRFPEILRLLRDISKKRTGLEYIETILKYIVNAAPTDNINDEDLRAAVDEALTGKGGEIMPTIADLWIEQGMQQGMQQGLLEEGREMILEALDERFNEVPSFIFNAVNQTKDRDVLKFLLRRAVRCTSLEE
ncbi:MAG: Rpn family recombination-promoting nuclease/putative transposase, partial [Nanoarchaeota archaeon]|nr:Rpn family recombination-promoting nuclease/putative transposase [Nanoarchaeota archaeon]